MDNTTKSKPDLKNFIYLDVLNLGACNIVREWRNKLPETLRTPFRLTYEQQVNFYESVVCNRNSKHRYFGIFIKDFSADPKCEDFFNDKIIGMGGITNIEFENGLGEISLILGPEFIGKGFGSQAVKLLLDVGFNQLRLNNIYGECFKCNKNIGFWEKQIKKYNAVTAILPSRKYYNGEYYDSLYFNFNEIDFEDETENNND